MDEKIEFWLTRAEAEAIRRLLQGRRDYLKSIVEDNPERRPSLQIVDDAFGYISEKLQRR